MSLKLFDDEAELRDRDRANESGDEKVDENELNEYEAEGLAWACEDEEYEADDPNALGFSHAAVDNELEAAEEDKENERMAANRRMDKERRKHKRQKRQKKKKKERYDPDSSSTSSSSSSTSESDDRTDSDRDESAFGGRKRKHRPHHHSSISHQPLRRLPDVIPPPHTSRLSSSSSSSSSTSSSSSSRAKKPTPFPKHQNESDEEAERTAAANKPGKSARVGPRPPVIDHYENPLIKRGETNWTVKHRGEKAPVELVAGKKQLQIAYDKVQPKHYCTALNLQEAKRRHELFLLHPEIAPVPLAQQKAFEIETRVSEQTPDEYKERVELALSCNNLVTEGEATRMIFHQKSFEKLQRNKKQEDEKAAKQASRDRAAEQKKSKVKKPAVFPVLFPANNAARKTFSYMYDDFVTAHGGKELLEYTKDVIQRFANGSTTEDGLSLLVRQQRVDSVLEQMIREHEGLESAETVTVSGAAMLLRTLIVGLLPSFDNDTERRLHTNLNCPGTPKASN